ncbi:MAG: superoxide dismutase family protein [Cyclobacteriaceae bacterium]
MNKVTGILFLLITVSCSQSDSIELPETKIEAMADIFSIEPVDDKTFSIIESKIGSARFSQKGQVVTMEIELRGMTPNSLKAVHIHNGTVEAPGRHWNQQSFYAFCDTESLGAAWSKPFAGDIGNVPVDSEGNGSLTIQTDLWALNSGDEKDILNKVIIVHEDPEDFAEECNPAHKHDYLHSNLKIGGGAITLVSDVEQNIQLNVMTQYPDFTICK